MASSHEINSIRKAMEAAIAAKDQHEMKVALEGFIEQFTQVFKFDVASCNDLMPIFWDKLFEWIDNDTIRDVQLLALEVLRLLTPYAGKCGPYLIQDRIHILLLHANLLHEDNVVRDTTMKTIAALKCLYNIIYNNVEGGQAIIDSVSLGKIITTVEDGDSKLSQIKLFDMKVVRLVSAVCKDIIGLDEPYTIKLLTKKLEYLLQSTNSSLSTPEVQVFCEILKPLFNLCAKLTTDKEDVESSTHLVKLLRRLLLITVLNDEMQLILHVHVANVLSNLPCKAYSALIEPIQKDEPLQAIYKYEGYNIKPIFHLLEVLKYDLRNFEAKPQDCGPILMALLKASKCTRIARKYLRKKILPPLQDVHTRPEDGNTLRNQLCRLLTCRYGNLTEITSSFLFVLCKEKGRMIKYTGYGNSAGLLAQRGLLAGGSSNTTYDSESEDSETEEYKQHKNDINPVIGCCEPPHPNPFANMSEEQKEHEVMKLVNLMDNLFRKGIVKPCKIGADGKLQPVEHILELQETLPAQQLQNGRKKN